MQISDDSRGSRADAGAAIVGEAVCCKSEPQKSVLQQFHLLESMIRWDQPSSLMPLGKLKPKVHNILHKNLA